MGEAIERVAAYLQPNPVLSLGLAFVAGFAAMKTVAYDKRAGFILFALVGLVGLILGEFVLIYYGLDEYLQPISKFRIYLILLPHTLARLSSRQSFTSSNPPEPP